MKRDIVLRAAADALCPFCEGVIASGFDPFGNVQVSIWHMHDWKKVERVVWGARAGSKYTFFVRPE
jgi:hypothetical protein